jgi:hypothetical protein
MQTSTTSVASAITNDGVIEASIIILSNGDLEQAIADGIVTEIDAETAIAALENGALGDYAS